MYASHFDHYTMVWSQFFKSWRQYSHSGPIHHSLYEVADVSSPVQFQKFVAALWRRLSIPFSKPSTTTIHGLWLVGSAACGGDLYCMLWRTCRGLMFGCSWRRLKILLNWSCLQLFCFWSNFTQRHNDNKWLGSARQSLRIKWIVGWAQDGTVGIGQKLKQESMDTGPHEPVVLNIMHGIEALVCCNTLSSAEGWFMT